MKSEHVIESREILTQLHSDSYSTCAFSDRWTPASVLEHLIFHSCMGEQKGVMTLFLKEELQNFKNNQAGNLALAVISKPEVWPMADND